MKKKAPKTVRFDPEQERRISLLAKQMADASFAQALRTVIGKGLEAEWLGSRLDGGSRVLVWRLEDGTVTEQRVPIRNVTVEARRRAFRIVR